MKRYSGFAIYLFITLLSCGDNIDKVAVSNEIFVLDNKLQSINTSEFIEDIQFIPLQTVSEGLLGEITKIIKTGDKYFILDSEVAKKIFVFDLMGNFLYTIGTPGRGPGEFMNPTDFCIDEDRGFLVIVDPYFKLIKTDLEGNFIMEKSLPQDCRYIDEVMSFEGFIYASTGLNTLNERKYKIIRFDNDLNPVGWLLPYSDPLPFQPEFNSNFHINGNELFFIGSYNYVFYRLYNNEFVPYYLLNFSGKEVQINEIDLAGTFRKNKSFIMGRLVSGTNLIYTWIWDEGKFYNGFFIKESNEWIVTSNIINDSHFFSPPMAYKDGRFISTINSVVFDELFPQKDLSVNLSDNPIIVEYKLSFKNRYDSHFE